jgi:hypothetical protein
MNGIHIRNKRDYTIIKKCYKNDHVLISEPKTEHIRLHVVKKQVNICPQIYSRGCQQERGARSWLPASIRRVHEREVVVH